MSTISKDSGSASPFKSTWDWKWPRELRVAREGDLVIVESDRTGLHPPDMRALTILEADSSAQEVLLLTRPIGGVELRLGRGWSEREVARLVRRLGLFPPDIRERFRVRHARKDLPIADAFGGALEPLFGNGQGRELVVENDGLGLLAEGLNTWLLHVDAIRSAALREDTPPLPVLRLVPTSGRMHPRADWILEQLRRRGIRVEAPEREPAQRETGFVDRLTDAVVANKEQVLGIAECGTYDGNEHPHILPERRWKEAVWEPLRAHVEAAIGGHRHEMFHNLKSSQAFAVNVLLGLEHEGALARAFEAALKYRPGAIRDAELMFEFCPPEMKRFLGERGRHQTQIDALVRLTLDDGDTEALLVEVKLTETDFGGCRGPSVEGNLRRDVCEGNKVDRLDACYLAAQGRTYLKNLDKLGSFADLLGAESCPLRDGGYQLARNLLVARWLEGRVGSPAVPAKYRVSRARFVVLCAAETPALTSTTLRKVSPEGGVMALERLGVGWFDARELVRAGATGGAWVHTSLNATPLCSRHEETTLEAQGRGGAAW